jgi:hypothetical protein
MIGYFRKNMSKIRGDNGSSLNIPITIKIIALTNITLIGGFPPELTFLNTPRRCAIPRDSPKFFTSKKHVVKILKK